MITVLDQDHCLRPGQQFETMPNSDVYGLSLVSKFESGHGLRLVQHDLIKHLSAMRDMISHLIPNTDTAPLGLREI